MVSISSLPVMVPLWTSSAIRMMQTLFFHQAACRQKERYRHVCSDVPMDYLTDARCEYGIALRVIRFEAASGSFVNLITNLPDHAFDIDDFKELYHLRWEQEIWARAILHNFCSEIALNLEIYGFS